MFVQVPTEQIQGGLLSLCMTAMTITPSTMRRRKRRRIIQGNRISIQVQEIQFNIEVLETAVLAELLHLINAEQVFF